MPTIEKPLYQEIKRRKCSFAIEIILEVEKKADNRQSTPEKSVIPEVLRWPRDTG